ncbi:pleckstrin homology (PH) domain-containing protein, partial [Striga asiatica]
MVKKESILSINNPNSTGEIHGIGCPHRPCGFGALDPTLNPKAHPPDRSSEEFPVLKNAAPLLVNVRYSKRRRSLSPEDLPQSTTHQAQQLDSGATDGKEQPQPKSWRDLMKEDRPHVVLSEAADKGDGQDDDDVIVEYGPDGPNLKFKDSFYEACVNSWRNVVIIKQLGAQEEVTGMEDIQMRKEERGEGDIIFKADKGKGTTGSKLKGWTMKTKGGTKGDSKGVEGAQIQSDSLAANDDSLNFLGSQGQTVVRAETALDPSNHRAVHVLDNPTFNNNNASGPEGFEDQVNIDMVLNNSPTDAQEVISTSSLKDQANEISPCIMEAKLDDS